MKERMDTVPLSLCRRQQAGNVCGAVHMVPYEECWEEVFLCVGSARLMEEDMRGGGLDKGSALGR